MHSVYVRASRQDPTNVVTPESIPEKDPIGSERGS